MTDNRSLEEFLGDGTTSEAAAEPTAGADPEPDEAASEAEPAAEGDAETAPDEPVEPMAETVVWSSAGGECTRCGAAVEERWHDGGALVCGDCKAW